MQASWQHLVWAQGMVLQPQHFQLLQQGWQQESCRLRAVLQYPNWGVIHIVFDQSALAKQQARCVECEILFPNGYYLQYPRHYAEQLQCDLTGEGNTLVTLYLCLPMTQQLPAMPGYTADAAATWQTTTESLADCYQASMQQDILLAKPMLRLQTEAASDCYSLPVGQVKRQANQSWQLNADFIVPVLQISGSAALLKISMRLLASLKTQLLSFGKTVNHDNAMGAAYANVKFILGQAVARLTFLSQHTQQSPMVLYQLISELIMQLAMELNVDVAPIPIYQAAQLTTVFTRVVEQLQALLQQITPTAYQRLCFEDPSQPILALRELSPSLLKCSQVYLAVAHQADDFAWIAHINKQVKVAACEHLQLLMTTALSGITLKHCQNLPKAFPLQAGFQYFSLDQQSDAWQQVLTFCSIAVYRAAELVPATMEIIFIKREA